MKHLLLLLFCTLLYCWFATSPTRRRVLSCRALAVGPKKKDWGNARPLGRSLVWRWITATWGASNKQRRWTTIEEITVEYAGDWVIGYVLSMNDCDLSDSKNSSYGHNAIVKMQ